jgi:hypothetical protein
MEFHRSLQAALQELYPNLELEPVKFNRMRSMYNDSEWTRTNS